MNGNWILIRRGLENDVAAVARIHLGELAGDFLPRLGPSVLGAFYRWFLRTGQRLYVAQIEGRTAGFLAVRVGKFSLAGFAAGSAATVARALALKPVLWPQAFWTVFGRAVDLGCPEIYYIVVESGSQRGGIGAKMIEEACRELKAEGHRALQVKTDASVEASNAFYQRSGFSLCAYEKRAHRLMNVYVREF